jgi:hypothetical protein
MLLTDCRSHDLECGKPELLSIGAGTRNNAKALLLIFQVVGHVKFSKTNNIIRHPP